MIKVLARTAIAYGKLTKDKMDEEYKKIIITVLPAIVGSLLLMFFFNAIIGMKEINYVFLLIGVFLLFLKGFSPKFLLVAMGGGALVQGLKDEDITQGSVKGLQVLYQLIMSVVLWFTITAGILSIIPFEAKPSAFFPTATAIFILTLTFAVVKNADLRKIISIVAFVVIGYSLAPLIPDDWKFWKGSNFSNQTSATKGARVTSVPEAPRARVMYSTVTVPAMGTVVVDNKLRCNGTDLPDEQNKDVTRIADTSREKLVITSKRASDLTFRIAFYDEGGDCYTDFKKLIVQGIVK